MPHSGPGPVFHIEELWLVCSSKLISIPLSFISLPRLFVPLFIFLIDLKSHALSTRGSIKEEILHLILELKVSTVMQMNLGGWFVLEYSSVGAVCVCVCTICRVYMHLCAYVCVFAARLSLFSLQRLLYTSSEINQCARPIAFPLDPRSQPMRAQESRRMASNWRALRHCNSADACVCVQKYVPESHP